MITDDDSPQSAPTVFAAFAWKFFLAEVGSCDKTVVSRLRCATYPQRER